MHAVNVADVCLPIARVSTRAKVMKRLVIGALFFVIGITTPTALRAEDWPRLGDGRAVIEIEGVKLGFPTKGPDLTDIVFNFSSNNEIDLKRVLESPEQPRRHFANGVRWISIPNVSGRDGLLLGRFDRSVFRSLNFSVSIGKEAQNNCRAWQGLRDQYRARIVSEQKPIGPDGWVEFANLRSPRSWNFVRAQDIPRLPKYFSSFVCDDLNFCTATSCVGSNAAFTYKFQRDVWPRASWEDVIKKASDVFRYLILRAG
jgi:hypothetical protein